MKVYVLMEGSTYARVLSVHASQLEAQLAALDSSPGAVDDEWRTVGAHVLQGTAEYADGDSRLFTITETTLNV